MKLLLSLTLLLTSSLSLAELDAEITCTADNGYIVKMAPGVLNSNGDSVADVTVLKDGVIVYNALYNQQYQYDPSAGFGLVEVWIYSLGDEGGIGVAGINEIEGKSDLFIDLGEDGYVDGSSSDCTIKRNN